MRLFPHNLYLLYINPCELNVPKIATVIRGFNARLANRPFLVLTFRHSGAQRQSDGKSKTKNGRLASLALNWIAVAVDILEL